MDVKQPTLLEGLRALDLDRQPVIVHASLKAFAPLAGGAQAVMDALLEAFGAVVMPTFTYKCMVTPLVGPPDNGLTYGSGADLNRMADFYDPGLPADPLMGILPETLRQQPGAVRSMHPILSFAGLRADGILAAQEMSNPLAPIGALAESGGWALLLGVDHAVNTSIHYAERLAGRRQFIRWALTADGVRECPGFPGCSAGFQAIAPELEDATRRVKIKRAQVQAMALKDLFEAVVERIKKDPLALLCQQEDCERCNQVRKLA